MTRRAELNESETVVSPDATKTSSASGASVAVATDPAARSSSIDDDVRYHLFKLLDENPQMTQREAAEALGISLGKMNYCFRALMQKGWVKARNFRNSRKKSAYIYLLTPQGIEEKMRVTKRFLDRKLREYDLLVEELHVLTDEVNEQRRANGEPEVDWQPAGAPKGEAR